ncbi:MAG: PBP1A family penicillin-binding protein [Gammaproteobacteria bacterium]
MTIIKTLIKINSKALVAIGIATVLIMLVVIGSLESKLPTVAVLKDIRLQVPLRIYSYDRKLIAEYGDKRCTPISLAKVPQDLINAVVATEDHRFFQHPGVDIHGLIRAAISLILTGEKDQGGSTITMQVARNFFLTRKKTYLRKINEILLALKIEKELNKHEILELYLNKIYFGKHAYGIAAAAEVYYGVHVEQLSLAQMAMLAGLPQAPSTINPINSPLAALKRRSIVLDNMLAHKYINEQQYVAANAEPIETVYHGKALELDAPYIAEMVRQELVDRFGEEIYDRGYEVVTTIDSNMQIAANAALARALLEYDQRHNNKKNLINEEEDEENPEVDANSLSKTPEVIHAPEIEGALVAVHPDSGAIVSLVGGFSFKKSAFNRAIQAERQPGSNFKPFIYGAALENGFTTATVVNDAPIVQEGSLFMDDWRPQNYTKKFYGPTSLRTGIIKSRNLVSIRLLQELGIEKAIEFIEKCGFTSQKLPKTLSLALGTNLVTPLELATGFSVFANGGYKITSYFIDSIFDYQGNILFKVTPSEKIPAIKPQTAYLITSILQEAITKGTGRKALELGRKDLAGKTGTTNDYMDAWYSGYNRDLVVTTWVGFDEPKSMREYAVKTALPMWVYFMEKALQGKPENPPLQPDGLVTVKIDPATGLLARPDQKDSIYEIFTQETVPTEVAPLVTSDSIDNASGVEGIF